MEKIKIGFIGGGHMAGALIGGLLKVGEWPPENIFVAERNENIRLRLSQDRGVCVLETPSALPKDLAAVYCRRATGGCAGGLCRHRAGRCGY